MQKKKRSVGIGVCILLGLILVIISILFYGQYKEKRTSQEQAIKALNGHISILNTQIKTLKDEVADLTDELSRAKGKYDGVIEEVEALERLAVGEDAFSIYSVDIDTYKPRQIDVIEIAGRLTLEQKLQTLAKEVSEQVFNELPIEIQTIEEINNQKIAVINLIDESSQSWEDYFGGSAGGARSQVALIDTFLQKAYAGEWIDGIRFLHNGGKLINSGHAEALDRINYR